MRLANFQHWERQRTYQRATDLVLVSALGLFLEILLIRWLGAEIRIFAYFKNFTLVSCFFGLGLGFILAKRRLNSFVFFPLLLMSVVVCVDRIAPILRKQLRHLPSAEELHAWSLNDAQNTTQAVVFYAVVAGAFLFLTFVFVPLGQLTGRLMNSFRPLAAYSLNLTGSVAGIAAFSVLSFLSTSPFTWLAVSALATLLLFRNVRWMLVAVSVPLVVSLVVAYEGSETTYWSPYQKIIVSRMGLPTESTEPFADGGYLLETNQDYHQKLINLGLDYVEIHRERHPYLHTASVAYALPYRFKPRPKDVLVLGAGAGNDVAAALRYGAERVVAVEIDPLIVGLGRELHPEQPYASQRVEVQTGDARAFIQRERRRFDLIIYGLVDSHTLLSSRSEIRLDNFLYTLESFRDAHSLLKEDGVLALTFSIPRDKTWLATRLFNMLEEVFDEEPLCRATGYDRSMAFVVGAGAVDAGPRWEACQERVRQGQSVPLATDDWPFLYLKERAVPGVYLSVVGITVALAGVLLLILLPETRKLKMGFFLLGAAFMLIEVKAVTELALVFGTTWFVSAVAVLGILVVALAANLWVQYGPSVRLSTAYVLLVASLAVGYLFPAGALLEFNLVVRGLAAVLLLCSPVFFAGLIFSTLLRSERSVESAFGSNLFGAMVGGFLEYSSLSMGIKSLYLVAAVLYVCSYLFARRGKQLHGET